MKFEKIKEIGDLGITSMLVSNIGDKVLVYGGSNFINNERIVHNDMYLLDKNMNIIFQKKGMIRPDRGICVTPGETVYFISGSGNSKIYKYYLKNNEIIEEFVLDLGIEIIGGFGAYYNGKIYFGRKEIYEFDIANNIVKQVSEFPAIDREQSVFFSEEEYLYIISGAAEEAYLDSYKYNMKENNWEKLNNSIINFAGGMAVKIEKNKFLITGGFNKEIYDEAIQNLKYPEYKEKYLSKSREEFNWNKKIFIYNTEKDEYNLVGEDYNSAKCGHGLVKINNNIYIINGEYKPRYRDNGIYKGVIE